MDYLVPTAAVVVGGMLWMRQQHFEAHNARLRNRLAALERERSSAPAAAAPAVTTTTTPPAPTPAPAIDEAALRASLRDELQSALRAELQSTADAQTRDTIELLRRELAAVKVATHGEVDSLEQALKEKHELAMRTARDAQAHAGDVEAALSAKIIKIVADLDAIEQKLLSVHEQLAALEDRVAAVGAAGADTESTADSDDGNDADGNGGGGGGGGDDDDASGSEEIEEIVLAPTAPAAAAAAAPAAAADDGDDAPALVADHGAADDINKAGLRRAKKMTLSAAGKKAAPQMEDTHVLLCPFDGAAAAGDADAALCCVFDGHAGKAAAETALTVVPEELQRLLAAAPPPADDRGELLRALFAAADERLKEFEYEGCTATVLFAWRPRAGGPRVLQCANVGDSTAFLCRAGGGGGGAGGGDEQVLALSVDHKPTVQSERERLKAAGIELGENQKRINGLSVSRALGDHFPKEVQCGLIGEPDVHDAVRVGAGDFVVVASDGLWDVMSGADACALAAQQPSAKEAADALLAHALQQSRCVDNVTVAVLRF